MLDPKELRLRLKFVAEQLSHRGFELDQQTFNELESKRKVLQKKIQDGQAERNRLSKAVGVGKAQGTDVSALLSTVSAVGGELEYHEKEFQTLRQALLDFELMIPNLPHPSVPVGTCETDNRWVREWGERPSFDFTPQDHVSLGEQRGWLDFESAAKLSGARFTVLYGALAQLQRALAQWMLDVHVKRHGYQEVYVPYLVRAECLYGTGQLPKFREDQFMLNDGSDLVLIPTAEVPLANLARDSILEADRLPVQWVAHTPCFRREAGAYGKDTRGMIRQHQFEKVELVQLVKPENSYDALEKITQHAEKILQELRLPYRVMELCTGDLGFSAAKTYDLEVWLPGQNRYREISSCSNCEAFQARRLQARWRSSQTAKPDLLHTLNGSGLAVGRTLIAVMENYQDSAGRIAVPEVLQPYLQTAFL